MANIYDVNVNQLITKTAEELKKVDSIQPPEWSRYAKTGVHKERPPMQADWWHIRSAAVLRSVYKLGPIGVSKLRKKYGGRKNRGYKPEEFRLGSGNVLRKILQQLEKAGLIKQTEVGVRKGRVVTGKGRSFIDQTASQIYVKASKTVEAKAEPVEAKAEPVEAKAEPVEAKAKEE